MFTVELFCLFCPDGITPNSGLSGPNNTYIYIYMYVLGFTDPPTHTSATDAWHF